MKKPYIIFATICFLSYLMGAFVEVSFDISQWNPVTRVMVGVLGPLMAALMTSFSQIDRQ
jgi:hypothetical protein